MEPKTEIGKRSKRDPQQNVEAPRKEDSELEQLLSFWGSYCLADVWSWTQEEVDGFADSLEAIPEPIRRMRSIIETKNDDKK